MSKFTGFPISRPSEAAFANVTLQQIGKGEPGYADAWPAPVYINEPLETIIPQVKYYLAHEHWWLQEYWFSKGPPTEQFDVTLPVPNGSLTIYVYGDALTQQHLDVITATLGLFEQISPGILLSKIDYLVFDDQDFQNPYSGEAVNGEAGRRDGMMWISRHGRLFCPHRIQTVSNFEGTLIHECAHRVTEDGDFEQKWRQEFSWRSVSPARQLPGGDVCRFINDEPHRCVTDYAALTPDDDIAESFVASIKDPDLLDPLRRAFIKISFLNQLGASVSVSVLKRRPENINLPALPRVFRYRLQEHTNQPVVVIPSGPAP